VAGFGFGEKAPRLGGLTIPKRSRAGSLRALGGDQESFRSGTRAANDAVGDFREIAVGLQGIQPLAKGIVGGAFEGRRSTGTLDGNLYSPRFLNTPALAGFGAFVRNGVRGPFGFWASVAQSQGRLNGAVPGIARTQFVFPGSPVSDALKRLESGQQRFGSIRRTRENRTGPGAGQQSVRAPAWAYRRMRRLQMLLF